MTAGLVQPEVRLSARELARLLGGHPPTPEQIAIIEAPLEPAVIIAGAGSGKTETIATRVAWLIANGLAEPGKILGLTFTRKAAAELNQRITARLRGLAGKQARYALPGSDPAAAPAVSTYASYAAALVDEHGLRLGFEPGARLLTGAARWQLAWDVVSRFDGEFHADIGAPRSVTRYVLALADEMSNHLITSEQVRGFSAQLTDEILSVDSFTNFAQPIKQVLQRTADRVVLLQLVERFQQRKAELHVRDFADQMRLATEVTQLPAVIAAERSKYDVVLLDEYQDTSYSETFLLAALFADARPVTAVGDPLQAIYGWRGASASNITGFATRFRRVDSSPATEYSLMTSWRNDTAVLAGANRVAAAVRSQVQSVHAARELMPRPAAEGGTVRLNFAATTIVEAEWIAEMLAAEWAERTDWTAGVRTAAVLVRKRAHIPAVVAALTERGLPTEVLSLGGLLSLPEVVDVISTLRVMTDIRAGAALTRLLTGPRWRIGSADVVALSRRASEIARAEHPRDDSGQLIGRIEAHLIDALDSLGQPGRYSEAGFQRMTELSFELAGLRRRADQPLPDLIEDIVRTSGLAVELAVRGSAARANVDRLVEEAAVFAAESAGSIPSFLAYLQAAKGEDRGLEIAEVQVSAERIQVLTVHAAKGLEWDVVALPGLAEGSFPAEPTGESWTKQRGKVPFELRGDADALPVFDLRGTAKASEVNKRHTEFITRVNQHRLKEERRLAYVALTRARKALYCSGAAWSPGTKTIKKPAGYLLELASLHTAVQIDGLYVPEPDESNPLTADSIAASWPAQARGDRQASVAAAADLVRAETLALAPSEPQASPWAAEVELLLSERRSRRRGAITEVVLPGQLSASELVALAQDRSAFARRLRRPMPSKPSAAAERGSAFHEWLEQRFAAEALLDIEDLFPDRQAGIGAAELAALRESFLASAWAERMPVAVEVGFEFPLGATILRGRMDAVFADPDGGFTIVDWKTGREPGPAQANSKAIQLAAYRLAWAGLNGIADAELSSVRAAFHYVTENRTVYPDELLGADGLRALLSRQ